MSVTDRKWWRNLDYHISKEAIFVQSRMHRYQGTDCASKSWHNSKKYNSMHLDALVRYVYHAIKAKVSVLNYPIGLGLHLLCSKTLHRSNLCLLCTFLCYSVIMSVWIRWSDSIHKEITFCLYAINLQLTRAHNCMTYLLGLKGVQASQTTFL